MTKKLARVFTVKNQYTPDDDDAYYEPPGLFVPEYDEVHVSCSFTWDKPKAEQLAEAWRYVCDNVKVGGPAYDDPAISFTPGRYIKKGYTITSRGCYRKCPFCFVPRREGRIRELEIHDGQWHLDNNILACSKGHILSVFEMMERQKKVKWLGGFDTYLLKDWHVERLAQSRKRIETLYIAFDEEKDRDSVEDAIRRFSEAGFKFNQIQCFVLVGFDGDTIKEAEKRCEWVIAQGGTPFPSYFRPIDEMSNKKPKEWAAMTARWTYMPGLYARLKREGIQYYTPIRGILAKKEK